jgi:hypothetical protein
MGCSMTHACIFYNECLQGFLTRRKCNPLGPYRRPRPKVLGGSRGGAGVLMSEVPL